MHFRQVMPQRHFRLALEGVFQRFRGHKRVAVAVAANPLAHTQKTVNRQAGQVFFQFSVKLGYFVQKRGLVITQRVVDFVCHRQFGITEQAGLPQLKYARADLRFVGGQFALGQYIFRGVRHRLMIVQAFPLSQQAGDVPLRIQNAFALNLGGMCGEHR